MSNTATDIVNFLKPKLLNIGVSEDNIYLYISKDEFNKWTNTHFPKCFIIMESSQITNVFGREKELTADSNGNYILTESVYKIQNIYISLIDNRNNFIKLADDFYKEFDTDYFIADSTGKAHIEFYRDEYTSLNDKKLGYASADIFMRIHFSLFNKKYT